MALGPLTEPSEKAEISGFGKSDGARCSHVPPTRCLGRRKRERRNHWLGVLWEASWSQDENSDISGGIRTKRQANGNYEPIGSPSNRTAFLRYRPRGHNRSIADAHTPALRALYVSGDSYAGLPTGNSRMNHAQHR